MPEIKLQHILTMTRLLQRGAKSDFIQLTTTDLGKFINRSQQAASRHLLDLESAGYIERLRNGNKFAVKVTNKGYSQIDILYSELKHATQPIPVTIDLKVTIVSRMVE